MLAFASLGLPTALIVLVVIALLGVAIVAILKAKLGALGNAPDEARLPYTRAALLTAAELSFFRVLETATDGRFHVSIKVRMGDVLTTERGLSRSDRATAWNRIKAKHLDFVLCDPHTMDVVAAIELDDRSHEREDREDRDDFVDRACEAAGLRLIRVPARAGYSVNELRGLL